MKSNFEIVKEQVEKLKCKTCGGLGTITDAYPGDISFNEYTCKFCNGTGWKNAGKKKLVKMR